MSQHPRTSTRPRAYCPECDTEYPEEMTRCPEDGAALYPYQAPTPAADDELLGVTLDGRFRLDRVLGEGGMGKIYAATQLSVDQGVAVKVLRPEVSSRPQIVKRFFREGRVISGLSHPNVIHLLDFGKASPLLITLIIGAALTLILVAGLGTLVLAVALSEEDETYAPYPGAYEPYPGEPMPPGAPPPPEPGEF